MAAFELAARQRADGIEFDVHLSRDNIPVVIHDGRLGRTAPASGSVRSYTAAELKRLDAGSWFNRRYPELARTCYAGERIPLLSEVLCWIRKRKLRAYLEIKLGGVVYPGVEEKVMTEVERADAAAHTTIISFDLPTLKRLRGLSSDISLGIDFTRPVLAVHRAIEIQAGTVLPHWRFASLRFIRRSQRAGIRVMVWDLDHERAMRRKVADGVDGIITRYPGLARTV